MNQRRLEAEPVQPLVEELTPAPDPWEVCVRLRQCRGLLFLDSAGHYSELGRYSFVMADPVLRLWTRGRQVVDGSFNEDGSEPFRPLEGDPFAVLQQHLKLWHAETVEGLPPFQGGAAGLFGYDLCHHTERLPRPRRDEFQTPDMAVGLYPWVVAFDHRQRRAWVISTGFPYTDPARRRRAPPKRWVLSRRP